MLSHPSLPTLPQSRVRKMGKKGKGKEGVNSLKERHTASGKDEEQRQSEKGRGISGRGLVSRGSAHGFYSAKIEMVTILNFLFRNNSPYKKAGGRASH